MTKEHKNIRKSQLAMIWAVIVALAIMCLTILEYFTLTKENKVKAYQASDILITEIEHIVSNNEDERANLQLFLENTYINKAKTVAYALDSTPTLQEDAEKMKLLAQMMGLDEIHIFDETGRICGGSVPGYYGLSMDSGEQLAFFKPMLWDRHRCMSQSIMPNTAEKKRVLYSMCWNESGTQMVQVGVNADHFPKVLNINQMDSVIAKIPEEKGTDIILTKNNSDAIIAATAESLIGKRLADIGINLEEQVYEDHLNFESGLPGNTVYCSVQDFYDYRVVIAQNKHMVDENVTITLVTFAEYLILVFIAMTFVLDYLYSKFLQEKACALIDKLTDLSNRRAYENTLDGYENDPIEDNLIFVSMDVNGLKTVNDTHGHNSGDKLLQGAASCIQKCFGPYGETFRYGGDEFVAIIYTDEVTFAKIRRDFQKATQQWSQENGIELHLSMGIARRETYPRANITQIAEIADREMYRAKAQFYAKVFHDQRGRNHEME